MHRSVEDALTRAHATGLAYFAVAAVKPGLAARLDSTLAARPAMPDSLTVAAL